MKIFEANSSMPGVDDGLLIYSGVTPDNEGLQDLPIEQYIINTQIRSNPYVSLDAVGITFNQRFQIGFLVIDNNNGTKSIRFQVPRFCRVYYYICGSSFDNQVHSELVKEDNQETWTHGYYLHNHDGFSGVQLTLGNNIQPDNIPFNANKKVVTNHAGNRFIYVPIEQGNDPPGFTLPALNTPEESIEINGTIHDLRTWSWDAASNMTHTDKYNIIYTAIINPLNSFTSDDIAGDVTSVDLYDDRFDGMSGEVFYWTVRAENTDGTGETEGRLIFITP